MHWLISRLKLKDANSKVCMSLFMCSSNSLSNLHPARQGLLNHIK